MGSVLGSVVFHMFLVCVFQCLVQETSGNLVGMSCSGNVCCLQKRVCFPRCGNTCLQSSAPVQPLLSRIFPTVSKAADSMCIPPNMMTNFDSPWTEGHVHRMFLAMVNSGWSIATTGACPGWTSSVHFLMTSNGCLTMAVVAASSWKSGNRYDVVVGDSVRSCRIALKFLNKWLPFCKMVAINVRMVYILQ